MKIAVVGTGNVASVLGKRLATVGHEITFISRSPWSDQAQILRSITGVCDVVSDLDGMDGKPQVIIYAGPFNHAEDWLREAHILPGTILVDCTNPLNETFDALQLGHTESAGEKISHWATGTRVVKAFNTTSVATMADPNYGDHIATQFYCGDDAVAKQVIAGLIRELGMEAVDAGPLRNSRYLEATAMLYIHLAVREGWGGNCALKILRRNVGK